MSLWSCIHTTHNSEHNPATKKESPSRNSVRTEEREGRCLRSPCRSRPCTRDRQLGFWGASTLLPNPPPLFVFLKLVRVDFFFPVERSSSSSTSWKLVKDRDHQSAWEGMIRSSSCCVSSSCPYYPGYVSYVLQCLFCFYLIYVSAVRSMSCLLVSLVKLKHFICCCLYVSVVVQSRHLIYCFPYVSVVLFHRLTLSL